MDRQRFLSAFKRRFALRLHMTAILAATILAGVVGSKIMLVLGLDNVEVRYPVIVVLAYCVFFAALKLWLWLVGDRSHGGGSLDGNAADLLPDLGRFPGSSGSAAEGAFTGGTGGGGNFGGGGASASFDGATAVPSSDAGPSLADAGDAAAGVASGADEGIVAIIVLALLALLLSAVLGAGIFLVYNAPVILAEAAFDAMLAASLARASRKMHSPDWMGSVFRATWKPFAIIFALALISGFAMHHFFPNAVRMIDVIRIALEMLS